MTILKTPWVSALFGQITLKSSVCFLSFNTLHTDCAIYHLSWEIVNILWLMSEIFPQWTISELACYTYSLVSVPLYDTLGTEAIGYILDKSTSISHAVLSWNGVIKFWFVCMQIHVSHRVSLLSFQWCLIGSLIGSWH